jgi:hypothetical protein
MLCFRFLNFVFGERHFPSTSSSCSLCSVLLCIVLVPVALVLGVLALALAVALAVLFLPVFLVSIVPCVLFVRARRGRADTNVIKRFVDSAQSPLEEHLSLADKLLPAENGAGVVISDSEAKLYSDLSNHNLEAGGERNSAV